VPRVDILYLVNAPLSEVDKVLNIIGHVVVPASAGAAIYTAVDWRLVYLGEGDIARSQFWP